MRKLAMRGVGLATAAVVAVGALASVLWGPAGLARVHEGSSSATATAPQNVMVADVSGAPGAVVLQWGSKHRA